ncbi:aldehyde dehydrogenase family protein [Hyphomicrobium sp.]|uniref:aldehyde dehydrogenase family protein n=1 Tax=Hyphomicrobium sp. TaxID=82 RepID=UPI002E355EE6|nr:aldehyde dehydrogenase family protein [Hyphomicrobium sp.]HEX2843196.1 aldehyde dehydrogenase family protein [Hyphomicrobium sp.]
MAERNKFYIGGNWVAPSEDRNLPVVNPATEEVLYNVALGNAADVDRAVAAAREAWPKFAATTREDRLALLARILELYSKRMKDVGGAISDEMGAPLTFAERVHAGAGLSHFMTTQEALKTYVFEERIGAAMVVREPIGVAGQITPWNWPMNQMACKIAPALAAGCTMVLKPSEYTPTAALILAEVLHDAGVPPGVFNLVNGLGPEVGAAMSGHPGLDMISFTGSTRAGIDVATRAAPTVKRVTQELGGKSANIILADADFEKAVTGGARHCFANSGQSCNAPTRMLVPETRMREAAGIAAAMANSIRLGDPRAADTDMGPVANRTQWEKIQRLIASGVEEGATVAAGGPGRPQGLNKGFFVRPTVFADVKPEMTIAREEIFGPVLSILAYKDEDDAVRIANDTPYGLAGYVSSGDIAHARAVARRIRAGNVNLNGAMNDRRAPFGGYKQSGNGREWGRFGIEEYLEVKAIGGWGE